MGGEKTTSRFFTPGEEIISPVDDFDFPLLSMNSGDDEGSQDSWDSLVDQRRRDAVFREVLQSYDQLRTRIGSLTDAKNKILSYTPGAWIENVGGMTLSDYDVPKTTSLLLIGPKGSGKSSLVNRISKVFENDKFASERAQVTYNSSVGDGTYFLQEYTIPRGVRHGELVIRRSDSSSLRNRMRCKARKIGCEPSVIRKVNFVIFVVDGLAVLKSMEGDSDVEKQYDQIVATTFNCPYLSFRDDKPVVVVTHGDLLSLTDRARIRTYLGELLGIPPAKQIFDIPESSDPENELIIIDMLRYCLEHADRNLSCKSCARNKGFRVSVMAFLNLLLVLGIAIIAFKMQHLNAHRIPKSNSHVDWRAIRHLWLD
ncbi:hypothetical protein AB3S75_022394 [Citrus x aurantiifolia]